MTTLPGDDELGEYLQCGDLMCQLLSTKRGRVRVTARI